MFNEATEQGFYHYFTVIILLQISRLKESTSLVLGFLFLHKNIMTKKQVGKKGFIQLILPHCCSSPKEGRTGTQAGLEPGGRS